VPGSPPRRRKKAAPGLPFFVCAAAILALLAGSAGAAAAADRVVPRSTADVELSYAPIVKKAAPAVVNIYARRIVKSRGGTPFNDPFFGQFFGQFFSGQPRERVENSLGSGVILRPDGVIVTNSHVINGAQQIVVALSDGREFEATVVTDDTRSDLAVLRIKAAGPLPFLELADSDEAEVGDIVLAIGDPYGVGQTVTSGIVSATERTRGDDAGSQFFIQTDAAINPGNSGGALIDMAGHLLGINSAIYTRSGGNQGIGFAIPANLVDAVLESVLKTGKVVRAWTGLNVQTVTSDLAKSLGLARPQGVMVTTIHPESSFGKAGVKTGDVITGIDGLPVDDPGSLLFRIATRHVGDVAKVELLRKGKAETLSVPLIAAPEVPPRDETDLSGENPFSGATVGNLSPAYADELGVDSALQGVIVAKVDDGSYAAQLGLRADDIILAVNGTKIGAVADLKEALKAPARRWSLEIRRDGQVQSVTVQL
jgi:serine protease Do